MTLTSRWTAMTVSVCHTDDIWCHYWWHKGCVKSASTFDNHL